MKEIGRMNVSKEMLDEIFNPEHRGVSVKDCVGQKICTVGFVLYDMEDGGFHLKFIDDNGVDYYTSSQVFIKDYMRLRQGTDDTTITITIEEGTSSKGRKYLTIKEAPKKTNNSDAWRNMTW